VRRGDEYRAKQVWITVAVMLLLGGVGFGFALWLKPDFAPFVVLIALWGAVMFGMCTWYDSANDPDDSEPERRAS